MSLKPAGRRGHRSARPGNWAQSFAPEHAPPGTIHRAPVRTSDLELAKLAARLFGVSRADGQFANHPAPFTNDHWRAWMLSNYDGDTITVCYDAGFFDTGTRDVRLFGINAPELRTGSARSRAKGLKAKNFLTALLPSGTPLALVTSLDPNLDDPSEKYGRILAQVVKYNPDGTTTDVNAAMLASGLVVAYNPTEKPPMQKARKVTVKSKVRSSKAGNNFGMKGKSSIPGKKAPNAKPFKGGFGRKR